MKLEAIADKVATEASISKAVGRRFAKGLFEGVRAAVEAGEKVAVAGLGVFAVAERTEGERVGKNGKTKTITAARYVTLRPSRKTSGKGKRAKADAKTETTAETPAA